LDGDLSEWSDITEYKLHLSSANRGLTYASGDVSIKYMYDDTHIYMPFEVPGPYRFDTSNNHLCASMSTMWWVGQDATFMNMGGCYSESCNGVVPELCSPFRVDLGGHWELKTTEMGVEYRTDLTSGSGNDPIANKDDE
jgi:hypothetical protein